MRAFDRDTFLLYYQNSFVRSPRDGQFTQIAVVEDDGTVVACRRGGERETFHYTTLEWEHVRIPELGYRMQGSVLHHHSVMRQNNVAKGLNNRTIRNEVPVEMLAVQEAAGRAPIATGAPVMSWDIVDEISNPRFTHSLSASIKLLVEDKYSLASVIDKDTAVCLGVSENACFLLLYKGRQIASSIDGKDWQVVDTCLSDILDGIPA